MSSLASPMEGASIVLKGGEGRKRRFNKKEARVVDCPTRGCWMSVQCRGEIIKWRKGRYDAILCERVDPMEKCGEEIFSLVLPFLVGEPNETTCCLEAAKCHAAIRSVCAAWNETIDRSLVECLGLIHLNLNSFVNRHKLVAPLLEWLGRNEIRMASLDVDANLPDIPILQKLLNECDTEGLIKMRAYINKGRHDPGFVGQFVHSVKDLTVVQVDGVTPAKDLTRLHNTIAETCPNLTELEVTLTLPRYDPDYSEYISTSLFSLPSITKLKVSLGFLWDTVAHNWGEERIEGKVLTNLIKNLSGLQSLKIATASEPIFCSRRFHIASRTLESLDVTGCTKQLRISCNCPALKAFHCKGEAPLGNGTYPLLSEEQLAAFEKSQQEDLVVRKGSVAVPNNFQVPKTCILTLERFRVWESDREFANYAYARLETYSHDDYF